MLIWHSRYDCNLFWLGNICKNCKPKLSSRSDHCKVQEHTKDPLLCLLVISNLNYFNSVWISCAFNVIKSPPLTVSQLTEQILKDKGRVPRKKNVFFMVFLRIKKLPPFFLSEIRSQMGETNFTFGPIPNFNLLFFDSDLLFPGFGPLRATNSCRNDKGTPEHV